MKLNTVARHAAVRQRMAGLGGCILTLALGHAGQRDRQERAACDAAYRFEHVDAGFRPGGRTLADANASTLRTSLSYRSAPFAGLSVLAELEDVARLGGGRDNDGSNGRTPFAAVIDPPGPELNQAWLQYDGPLSSRLRVGRQVITYRKAPAHRFIGNVLWRQNWQTFGAVSAVYQGLSGLTLSYAWVWNVNRIFGPDAPDPLSDFASDSHFVNVRFTALRGGTLEAYAYLLDFETRRRSRPIRRA